jgi:double-stranded uracil-DNA glycosylase
MRLYGFPPVVDKRTEILILGSFPSAKALAKGQYYGNPQNHFWRIMSAVLSEELVPMSYEERLQTLLRHKVGLWDVYASCERKDSMDANICNAVVNDFSKVPKLKRAYFNGQEAGKHRHLINVPSEVLPSSSPANFMRLDEKIRIWKEKIHL